MPGFDAVYPEEVSRKEMKEPFCADSDNGISEMIAERQEQRLREANVAEPAEMDEEYFVICQLNAPMTSVTL